MRITFLYSDGYNEYNSSHFRVTNQAEILTREGAKVSVISVELWHNEESIRDHVAQNSDVVVLQRVLATPIMGFVDDLLEKGIKVICDWDDAYDLIADENSAYPFWGKGLMGQTLPSGVKIWERMPIHPVDQMKMYLPRVTAGCTPSKLMNRDWDDYTRMIHIPNYLPPYYWDGKGIKKPTTVVGWGGSLSHLTSFRGSGVQDALKRVVKGKVKLLVCGDKRVVDELPFKTNVVYQGYTTWMDWPRTLSLYDIGIAPLSGAYDARRSWLKVAEYIARGIPFVATRSAPYEEFFDCKSGIFVEQGSLDKNAQKNPSGWQNALTLMLDNLDEYKHLAAKERSRYRRMLSTEHNTVLPIYRSLLEN